MSRFLIFYFIFYGGAHFYVYRKLLRAFSPVRRVKLLLALALPLLFISPLLARTLERNNLELAAELASTAGYWWMGLIFLFISAALFLDALNLLLSGVRLLWHSCPVPRIPPRPATVVPVIYALVVALYGWQEARTILTERVTIPSPKIPAHIGRVRLALISDVHAGQIVREKRIQDILRVVAAASPDLLISTGDLVDGRQKHFKGLEPLFRTIHPPLGKYAVTGNHEYYVGLDTALRFTRDAGFRVLMNESAVLGNWLTITGLADPGVHRKDPAGERAEGMLLAAADKGAFNLLLKHRPAVLDSSRGRFDLQLSGHVHKGQIFPFIILTWLQYPLPTGLSDQGGGSRIYVSRGTGVWGPPIRFLAPPEVTVIDLVATPLSPP